MGWKRRPYPRHSLQEPPPAPPILCPSASRGLQWYNRTGEEHQGENLKPGNHLGAGKEKGCSKDMERKDLAQFKTFFSPEKMILNYVVIVAHAILVDQLQRAN